MPYALCPVPFTGGIKIFPLRIARYIVRIENILVILLALSVCISEPLSRNIIRIIFVMVAVKFFIGRDNSFDLIKRYKFFLLPISAFAWWMIISSIYGGKLISDSNSLVYWFFFSHNMILFIPLITMIRQKVLYEKIFIALGISIFIEDFFIFYQKFSAYPIPITFLNNSPLQNAILYIILLPTFFILTFNELNLRKKIFFGTTFFISLLAFLFLYTPFALAEEFFKSQQIIWGASFEIVKNYPIMGVGLGNFNAELIKVLPEIQNLNVHHAFNTYLQFWAETGIFGLLLFCGIFGAILIWAKRRSENVYGRILFFSTLALMIYSFTDFIFESYSSMRVYWFLFGICVASLHR